MIVLHRPALALLLACDPAPTPVPTDSPASPVPPDSPPRVADHQPVPSASQHVPPDSHPPPSAPTAPAPADSPPAPPLASTPSTAAPVPSASPPPGFVDLRVTLPGACFAPGYAAADNFTGAPLPGYAAPGAWLLAEPAAALARLQAELAAEGLALLIFDAYRPRRASEAMVVWAERTGQPHLVDDGYISRRSGHNHGHTIDLGLARMPGCEPLDMGTPWDTLDERSHTIHATGPARAHRQRLRTGMHAVGFHDYPKEWWHFGYPLADTRPRDVPYGPHEPPESE